MPLDGVNALQELVPPAEPFGAQIAALRKARGLTQRELARSVHLTPEHLSRIEHGRRPPPRRPTVMRMAATLQVPPASEAFSQLVAAAGYLPDLAMLPQADQTSRLHQPAVRLDAATRHLAALPPVISGMGPIKEAALLLLQAAAERGPAADGAVSLSLSEASQERLTAGDPDDAWHGALRAVLSRGWRYRHLWQVHEGQFWPPQVIAELSALALWPMRYEPSYARGDQIEWSPRDLLVVPGVGALSGLAAGAGPLEATLVVRDPDHILALAAHFDRLAQTARPLLTLSLIGDRGASGNASRLEFDELLAEAHEEMGEHRLVKSGIPLRFVPSLSWWQTAHRQPPAVGIVQSPRELAYRRRLWECRQRVRRVLAAEMRVSRHREICTTHGLRRFAVDGGVASDDFLLDGLPPLSRQERADALLRLLGQLNSNPNYELALLDSHRTRSRLAGVMWVVKGARYFCLEAVHREADQRQDFMAVIADERLVTGFRDYFDSLWESVPERWRDKPRVERWLDRQLELLH